MVKPATSHHLPTGNPVVFRLMFVFLLLNVLTLKTCCDHQPNTWLQSVHQPDSAGIYPFGKSLLKQIPIKKSRETWL